MPLYVYECQECEIVVEERRTAAQADDLVECPICHGLCTRILSTFAIGGRARQPTAAPRYGRVPASYHGHSCSCCAPRRR
jgi:putative FmdB family regulatory protein